MALSHCKQYVELREILLKNRPKELISISSKGTVPVLQLNDNTILEESIDIMLWILNKNNSKWLDIDIKIQNDMISENDNDFKHYLDKYKYHDRYPENSKKHYNNECKKFLAHYETKLNNQSYLLSDSMQFADVAIFPFIRQYANVDKDDFKQTFPRLNHYLETFCNSKLFLSVMNKYKAWDKSSEIISTNFQ